MNERGQQDLWIAPIVASAMLIVISLVLLAGPALGGVLGSAHGALRDLLTGADQVVIDRTLPQVALSSHRASVQLTPAMPTVLPATEIMTGTLRAERRCASFQFQGALSIREDRLSFGRFNAVSNTEPYGKNDPLTSWKLVQIESLDLDLSDIQGGTSVTIPVDKTVSVLISDPFSQEMLFSAEWSITEIEVRGAQASINARLAPNLSDMRVNNPIDSDTLGAFSQVTSGVMVMHWTHTEDLAPLLRNGEPILAAMGGSVHMDVCLR